jgi:hypothetical protein
MKIDNPELFIKKVEELLKNGFTCGTIAAYMVSEFYKIYFDETDFLCSKNEMKASFLIEYLEEKGLFLSYRENNQNKSKVNFNFEELANHDILMIAIYGQYNGNAIGHCSVVLNFTDEIFDLMYGNNPYQMSLTEEFYSIFVSNKDILDNHIFWS